MHLEFDNEGPVMGESSVPVEREEGTFPVTCTAKGFNPSATLRLFVGDDEVAAESSAVSDSQMSGQARARRYMTTLTRQVELMAAHSDKTISCQAQAPSDASPRTASLPLQIIACRLERERKREREGQGWMGEGRERAVCIYVCLLVLIWEEGGKSACRGVRKTGNECVFKRKSVTVYVLVGVRTAGEGRECKCACIIMRECVCERARARVCVCVCVSKQEKNEDD